MQVALVKDLKEVLLPLNHIFLDPNNPRFSGEEWSYTPNSEIAGDAAQAEARRRLINYYGVEKLKMNMEVNGYLPIDRVVVREFDKDKYVVLEGNRRICAAKMISEYAADGSSVGEDVRLSLKDIPCLLYVGEDPQAAWVFQGLRHITGIVDWSAYNKAKLLVEQMERENLSLTDVGKRFGLTPYGAGQWVRGYYAFKQAKEESDFINEVSERAYPYFQELFSRSSAPVREWLEWADDEKKFKSAINFNEFVSWLYPRTRSEEYNDDEQETQQQGDFEKRVLKTRDDIRQISSLIREDRHSFEKFRRELDLEKAYSESIAKKYEREMRESINQTEEVFRVITECLRTMDNIPHKVLKDPTLKDRLLGELKKLESAIAELKE